MRTPGIQRMAGSANNNRFAVFEFEEDLFLEPIRVLDEKEIKLLKARDQQQNPEPKVSQVQRLPPNAITKASQVERVPSATTTNVSQSEKVSVVSSTKISHLERVPPIASTSATAETSTSIDADATAASECAAAGNSDADISDELLKCVNVMTGNVERLQQEVLRSVRMHSILKKSKQQGATYLKDRDAISTVAKKPRLFDAARTEAVKRKKVCDLMRLGGNILRQIMQHRWAWPFLQPVDVEGLQLHDYYQIIRNPMDLGTIRSRLEAKDGTGYGHVRELCEDVRLVFRNAMLYNESWTEVHVMAKALLAKFENKWKTSIEPRLLEEEEKLFEDQSEGYMVEVARVRTQDEQTAEQLHKDVLSQLTGVEKKLNDLLARFLSKSRPMKAEERRELYSRLKGLPAGSMSRVAELVSSGNGDKIDSDDISVDLETLDSSTLWRLHFFEKLVTQHVQEQAVSTSQIASSHQAK